VKKTTELLGNHRRQSQQSRLELGLGLQISGAPFAVHSVRTGI
jgi:hypothetical protein